MTRTEKRRITETMDAIMLPLMRYMDEQTKEVVSQALRILRDNVEIKSLEREPRTAHWETRNIFPNWLYCSECDEPYGGNDRPRYCPNCGAKMVESEG